MQGLIQMTDAELVSAYISGSNESMEVLVYKYKDKIYTSIYMLVKDRALADDLFQDVFVKIIRTIQAGNYSEQGKFLPWALRIAHNLCMDYFRKVRVDLPIVTSDGVNILDLLCFTTKDAGTKLEERQTCQTIRSLIESLPDEQREVVAMRIYGEQSFKEIADATGVSINTALGRMRYALINLRRMITENKLVLR